MARELRDIIEVMPTGKGVMAVLTADGGELLLVNNYVDKVLTDMEYADIVKYYSNRIDRFFVMPQRGWAQQELIVELKKWLKL